MTDVTQILSAIERGDPTAAEQLLPLVYEELRKLAAAKLAQEQPGQTLQATALVHEAYLRLVDVEQVQHWNSRGHFFGAAAEMRRLIVERARHKATAKAGGKMQRIDISGVDPAVDGPNLDVIALDEALRELEARNERMAQLVKLRFFAGLSNLQAANVLGIATSTADADWTYAKCWLRAEMSGRARREAGI